MKIRSLLFTIVIFFCFALLLQGQEPKSGSTGYLKTLLQIKTARAFSSDPIPQKDLTTIIKAGVNAPSALNLQPWHFSVITDSKFMKKIDEKAKSNPKRLSLTGSPVAIVISCKTDSNYAKYDSGMAADRMAVAAICLGYGTKIVATPCKVLNKEFRKIVGIPDGMDAVAVLLIGKEIDPPDASSGATTRNKFEEMVNFVPVQE